MNLNRLIALTCVIGALASLGLQYIVFAPEIKGIIVTDTPLAYYAPVNGLQLGLPLFLIPFFVGSYLLIQFWKVQNVKNIRLSYSNAEHYRDLLSD